MGAIARCPFGILKELVHRTREAGHAGHYAPVCGGPGDTHRIGENVRTLVGGLGCSP